MTKIPKPNIPYSRPSSRVVNRYVDSYLSSDRPLLRFNMITLVFALVFVMAVGTGMLTWLIKKKKEARFDINMIKASCAQASEQEVRNYAFTNSQLSLISGLEQVEAAYPVIVVMEQVELPNHKTDLVFLESTHPLDRNIVNDRNLQGRQVMAETSKEAILTKGLMDKFHLDDNVLGSAITVKFSRMYLREKQVLSITYTVVGVCSEKKAKIYLPAQEFSQAYMWKNFKIKNIRHEESVNALSLSPQHIHLTLPRDIDGYEMEEIEKSFGIKLGKLYEYESTSKDGAPVQKAVYRAEKIAGLYSDITTLVGNIRNNRHVFDAYREYEIKGVVKNDKNEISIYSLPDDRAMGVLGEASDNEEDIEVTVSRPIIIPTVIGLRMSSDMGLASKDELIGRNMTIQFSREKAQKPLEMELLIVGFDDNGTFLMREKDCCDLLLWQKNKAVYDEVANLFAVSSVKPQELPEHGYLDCKIFVKTTQDISPTIKYLEQFPYSLKSTLDQVVIYRIWQETILFLGLVLTLGFILYIFSVSSSSTRMIAQKKMKEFTLLTLLGADMNFIKRLFFRQALIISLKSLFWSVLIYGAIIAVGKKFLLRIIDAEINWSDLICAETTVLIIAIFSLSFFSSWIGNRLVYNWVKKQKPVDVLQHRV